MHTILVYMKEFKEIIEWFTKLNLEKEARATARFVETLAELGTVPECIHAEESKETEEHVIFTGKLKTKSREGRRTTEGKPTAWAIFAAHDEEQEETRVFSTSFTESARSIALSLAQDAQITVKGYPPIPAAEEGRRDRLHVFAILNHPNKQQNK